MTTIAAPSSYSGPIQFTPFPPPLASSSSSFRAETSRRRPHGGGETHEPLPPSRVLPVEITAQPLTRDNFSPFGDAIYNPRPGRRWDPRTAGSEVVRESVSLPFPVNAANQGTALRYAPVSNLQDLTARAPSRRSAGVGVGGGGGGQTMSMFVCSTRKLLDHPSEQTSDDDREPNKIQGVFEVKILERHPFTSQTFTPLSSTPRTKYLVVVAPTLSASDPANPPGTAGLPVPTAGPEDKDRRSEEENEKAADGRNLPSPGMPDLSRLQAFVCEGYQAVTYAAGTWHAPMVVLRNGEGGDRGQEEGGDDVPLAFLVYQTNTGVPAEDCQEVVFLDGGAGRGQGEEENEMTVGARVKVPVFVEGRSRL